MAEQRTFNEERFGYDVIGPCWSCGGRIAYFVDEDGTPRDIQPLGDAGMRKALERLHALAKVEGWSEPRGSMFAYTHHPDCDERCWVVRALEAAPPSEELVPMGVDALLDIRHEEDGSWSVSIRALPGHVGAAMTLADAFVEANDAAEAWIDTLREQARS